MSGIVGFVDLTMKKTLVDLKKMSKLIIHGGQKIEYNFSETNTLSVGFALTSNKSNSSEYFIKNKVRVFFSGQIYNLDELKTELNKDNFNISTQNASEVILQLFNKYELKCVERLNGNFTLVIYCEDKQKVYLCRDRVGVYPLFFSKSENGIIFSSELKVFMDNSNIKQTISEQYLFEFLSAGFISNQKTIFKGIEKALPGYWSVYDIKSNSLETVKYWDLIDFYKLNKLNKPYSIVVEECKNLIISSIKVRYKEKEKVGVMLSGGYDSTLVAAILSKELNQTVKSFTIGFPEGVDESIEAKRIADFLGLNSEIYNCNVSDANELIKLLPFWYDNLNGDVSCIPTLLVNKISKEANIDVLYNGDGSDEVFGGYNNYKKNKEILRKLNKLPSKSLIVLLLRIISKLYPLQSGGSLKKIDLLSKVLKNKGKNKYEAIVNDRLLVPSSVVNKVFLKNIDIQNITITPKSSSNIPEMDDNLFILDYYGKFSNMLLEKTEKASNAFSISSQSPFLDHRIIEYMARLPYSHKIDGRITKRIIKDITHQYLPKELMDRPKKGFDLPIYKWLRADLKYIVESFLSNDAILLSGFFNPNEIEKLKHKFFRDELKYVNLLWHILLFQMWYLKWFENHVFESYISSFKNEN